MLKTKSLSLAVLASGTLVSGAGAAISYTTPGALYSENFNSLPTDTRSSNNIEENSDGTPSAYSDGWQDDVDYLTSPQNDVSVLGWHLHHETAMLPTSSEESGFNGHQRYRQGTGNSGTGAFYGFASSSVTNPEKALGVVTSGTLTPTGSRTFIGLELVNNSGVTLTEFTLTYDGEQWRDDSNGAPDPLEFAWGVGKTDFGGSDPWHAGGGLSAVEALNFTGPTQLATDDSNDGGLDGNATENRVADISATVSGIDWQPGQSLWLRWRDTNVSGDDDGLGIDNVRFTAVAAPIPEPAGLALFGLAGAALMRRRRGA